MKRQNKTRKFILLILCAALILAVALGFVFARYTGSWEKDFGLTIKPVVTDAVLSDNVNGTLFDPQTEHIVFGNATVYAAHAEALVSTKKHVGSTQNDAIYSYYDAATATTYVLCDETIFFNSNSSALFKDLTNLQTVTLSNYSTAKVTDMSQMFYGCSVLKTVYDKGAFDTSEVVADTEMFTGCYALMGGEGTRVYPVGSVVTTQPLDKRYARIDGQNDLPGYFTGQESWARCYFRSNELKPVSQDAAYTVDGYDTWFTVANGLDSNMVSAADVHYTITYFVSDNGTDWVEYSTQSGVFTANTYQKQKFTVAPITKDGVTYNSVKVTASTESFPQEDLLAVFHFTYSGYKADYDYRSGVLRLTVNTNNQSGNFTFGWASGITPDNADPNGTFTFASVGPGTLTVALEQHSVYEYLFFVTDPTLLSSLESDSTQVSTLVTVEKK